MEDFIQSPTSPGSPSSSGHDSGRQHGDDIIFQPLTTPRTPSDGPLRSATSPRSHSTFHNVHVPWSPSNGTLLGSGKNSLSYSIELEPPSDDKRPTALSNINDDHNDDSRLSRSLSNLSLVDLQTKLDSAEARRKRKHQMKQDEVRQRHLRIKQKQTIQKHKEKLSVLSRKLKYDYAQKSAMLRRRLIIEQLVMKSSARGERARDLAVIKRLEQCMNLKKSYSTSFSELMSCLPDVDTKELFSAVNYQPDRETSQFTLASHLKRQSTMSSKPAGTVHSHQTPTSASRPPKQTNDKTVTLKRSESMPISPISISDSFELESVFTQDQMPPVTYKTLSELNLEAITANNQLRHDMLFDTTLEFTPNSDGERGLKKIRRADEFWSRIHNDITGANRKQKPTYKLIPPLINEIKKVLLDLAASEDYINSLEQRLDIPLIAQQLNHGAMDVQALFTYLGDFMKTHCAPVRDKLIDVMLSHNSNGDFAKCLRVCFDILEHMKLDVANDQLRRLRPFIKDTAVEYEWEKFKESLRAGEFSLGATLKWLRPHIAHYDSAAAAGDLGNARDMMIDAYLDLIHQAGRNRKEEDELFTIPESFLMDLNRILQYHNDWQDITIMACLLVVFRQAVGPKYDHQAAVSIKKSLWVLLNDDETTMSHITLHIADVAGKLKGTPLSQHDQNVIFNLIDKTLSPESKLYELMRTRISLQMKSFLQHRKLRENEDLIKAGLYDIEEEIRELAQKLGTVFEHNLAVHRKIYNELVRSNLVNRKNTEI